jgi:hypothetical protein
MSRRNKSGLADPVEEPAWKEPQFGPGSATCFCRVMDRREKAREARQSLRKADAPQEKQSVYVAPLVARMKLPVLRALLRRPSR